MVAEAGYVVGGGLAVAGKTPAAMSNQKVMQEKGGPRSGCV